MSQQRMIVTVDGVGASGKSALARLLAQRLGFAHLNSGLLYRAAAYLVANAHVDPIDQAAVAALIAAHSIELIFSVEAGNQVIIDGTVRDSELQSEEISALASQVAKLAWVREYFVEVQRRAFEPHGVVAEGRDMGTVIFPDAQVKFFIDADIKVRAARRHAQLAAKGVESDLVTIQRDLANRDRADASRAIAPMKAAEGAVLIDNSSETLDQVVERMYHALPRGLGSQI